MADTLEESGELEERPDPRIFRPELYEAVQANNSARAIELLNDDVPPSYIDTFSGWTSLHWAAINGNVQLVTKLLEKGAAAAYHRAIEREKKRKEDSKKKQVSVETNVNIESKEGNDEIVKDSNDKISENQNESNNENNNGNNETKNEVEEVEEDDEETRQDRKQEIQANLYKNTPLLWASLKGHLLVVWLLLNEGYSPNDVDNSGNNAVHLAASNGHIKVLKVLLDDGGNSNHINRYRNLPIDLATDRVIREMLSNAMTVSASWTEDDVKNKHENNIKFYKKASDNLTKILNEAGKLDSPRYSVVGAGNNSGDIMTKLPDIITQSKSIGIDEELILQAEKLLLKLECTQELFNDTMELRKFAPCTTAEVYENYVVKLEKSLLKAEANGATREMTLLAKELILSSQAEYWIICLIDRVKNIECAKETDDHDMKRLLHAIQKGQAFHAAEEILDRAIVLHRKLEAELGMSRAIALIPTVRLPMENPPEGYYHPSDLGKIIETEEYPHPPSTGEYQWEPSETYRSLHKAIDAIKASYNGADQLGANPSIITDAKEKLVKSEKDMKLLEVKNTADKTAAIEIAQKLAKKVKKPKK
jgi:ankyrin repeat protein